MMDGSVPLTFEAMPPTPVRSAPTITPTTHVRALVGVPAIGADPAEDGWFFSDFFLFNQLFRGLGASQRWYTSVRPDDLVQTYGEYVYGSPFHTRRVVLDAHTLPEDVVVRPESSLRCDFLEDIRSSIQGLANTEHHLLVLVFAHGDPKTFGFMVGNTLENPTMLTPADFAAVMIPSFRMTIFSTSCYSGGWVTSPLMYQDKSAKVAIMAATDEEHESESWQMSISRRMGGSMISSAVLHRLCKENIPDADESYKGFTTEITSNIFELPDLRFPTTPTFCAQDDNWVEEYHHHTGIPSLGLIYKDRYQQLRAVPAADLTPLTDRTRKIESVTDREISEWQQRHNLANPTRADSISLWSGRGRTGGITRSELAVPGRRRTGGGPKLNSVVRYLSQMYLNSSPGFDTISGNHIPHCLARRFLGGENLTNYEQEVLTNTLLYRIELIDLAQAYVCHMGLEYRSIWSFDPSLWRAEPGHADVSVRTREYGTWFRSRINDLFPDPPPGTPAGPFYMKPVHYLYAAAAAADLSPAEFQARVECIIAGLFHTI